MVSMSAACSIGQLGQSVHPRLPPYLEVGILIIRLIKAKVEKLKVMLFDRAISSFGHLKFTGIKYLALM